MDRNDEIILRKLTPDTLRVYNYLLKHNPDEVSLEELSQNLGLTKPTILHHIEKLKSLDIVEQTINGYKVKEIVKITIIKGYRQIIRKAVTTWIPLAIIFLALAVSSLMVVPSPQYQTFIIILCLIGFLISIIEIKRLL
ncbi:MAG: winged helix-turn-helix domain-containing protein [Candidatus Bathyarchaeota archaeon]|nr:winged helix-turn-helix domain-containing protein [Candidatus Bathyarchaeota archaeon]